MDLNLVLSCKINKSIETKQIAFEDNSDIKK